MSEGNGQEVIRVGRMGKRKFAFGDGEPFEIDVIVVSNQWLDIDRSFRDEKGEVAAEKLQDMNRAAWKFVCDVSGEKDLTLAEALAFIARVTEQAQGLQDFFVPRSSAGRSSRESTGVVFSE